LVLQKASHAASGSWMTSRCLWYAKRQRLEQLLLFGEKSANQSVE
jgi:hypothetical protein